MNEILDILKSPWHWSVAGVLVGLTVPALLLLGNKHFGISANLRHVCAACMPANIPFFKYDWRKERWNFFFIAGTVLGAFLVTQFLQSPNEVTVHPGLAASLAEVGITDYSNLVPNQLLVSHSGDVPAAVFPYVWCDWHGGSGGCHFGLDHQTFQNQSIQWRND